MIKKEGHIEKDQRKKILFLSDDIRTYSGVAIMAKEIVVGTSHVFNWVNLGGLIQHHEQGKRLDLSDATNKEAGIDDASVLLYPVSGYGNPEILREIIKIEKPDAIMIFTDPRYWIWLFNMEHEIRQQIPLVYLNIWDSLPYPYYNKEYYNSCDGLFAISKQTENINRVVLGEDAKDKVIKYVPHGINENKYFPIVGTDYEFEQFQDTLFNGKEYDFTFLFNARNLRRKCIPDLMLGFKEFIDDLSKQDPTNKLNIALVLHTNVRDEMGTDLQVIINDVIGEGYNFILHEDKLDQKGMNYLYNSCDACVLTSSNEGWGLSLTEAMMCGKPIIANATGGMQDQMRFSRANREWIKFDKEFGSNHTARVQSHGDWAFPVYPVSNSVIGSLETPYIFDDRTSPANIANAMMDVYAIKKYHPIEFASIGRKAREWVTSSESGMSASNMSKNIVDGFNEVFEKFKPREKYQVTKL